MSPIHMKSLSEFLSEMRSSSEENSLELTQLISEVADACICIAEKVSQGDLERLSNADVSTQVNIQGEQQKALDVISNDIFLSALEQSGSARGLASEEMPRAHSVRNPGAKGRLLLVFDPLDGSSNLDVHGVVGSIFSVLEGPIELLDRTRGVNDEDFLLQGKKQLAAGYALYGPSTMFVFAMNGQVNGFTLDKTHSTFCLTHPQMKVSESSNEYSVNSADYRFWDDPSTQFVDECVSGASGICGKDYSLRWTASLVAEVHRILIRGGVFLYPAGGPGRGRESKLRLLYEASPVAMLMMCASGIATDGYTDILDVEPKSLHQRVPLIFGSINEVNRVVGHYKGYETQSNQS